MFHKIPLGSVISLESICVTTGMKSCDNTIVELFWLKLLIVTFEILNDKPKVESRVETILFCVSYQTPSVMVLWWSLLAKRRTCKEKVLVIHHLLRIIQMENFNFFGDILFSHTSDSKDKTSKLFQTLKHVTFQTKDRV